MSKESKWISKIPFMQKLKNIKNIEIIIAVIFAAILFLIYFSSTSSGNSLFSSTAHNSSQTSFETRLSEILSDIEGAGNVSVFAYEEKDEIVGIIVISSGADNIEVRLNILKAIQTVLKTPTTNIQILVGNK